MSEAFIVHPLFINESSAPAEPTEKTFVLAPSQPGRYMTTWTSVTSFSKVARYIKIDWNLFYYAGGTYSSQASSNNALKVGNSFTITPGNTIEVFNDGFETIDYRVQNNSAVLEVYYYEIGSHTGDMIQHQFGFNGTLTAYY